MYLVRADDHFRAIGNLLVSERIALSPFTLARTMLMSCSAAFFILEPGIDVKERVGRWISLRLRSEYQSLGMVSGVSALPDTTQQLVDKLLGQDQAIGYELKPPSGRNRNDRRQIDLEVPSET